MIASLSYLLVSHLAAAHRRLVHSYVVKALIFFFVVSMQSDACCITHGSKRTRDNRVVSRNLVTTLLCHETKRDAISVILGYVCTCDKFWVSRDLVTI